MQKKSTTVKHFFFCDIYKTVKQIFINYNVEKINYKIINLKRFIAKNVFSKKKIKINDSLPVLIYHILINFVQKKKKSFEMYH